jgi:hypothetical protein
MFRRTLRLLTPKGLRIHFAGLISRKCGLAADRDQGTVFWEVKLYRLANFTQPYGGLADVQF